MSYETSYTLRWKATVEEDARIREYGVFPWTTLVATGYRGKWYSHEEDMRGISNRFPGVLFELMGVGEDFPDIWKKYFHDGRMQVAKAVISFPEFDPNKMS